MGGGDLGWPDRDCLGGFEGLERIWSDADGAPDSLYTFLDTQMAQAHILLVVLYRLPHCRVALQLQLLLSLLPGSRTVPVVESSKSICHSDTPQPQPGFPARDNLHGGKPVPRVAWVSWDKKLQLEDIFISEVFWTLGVLLNLIDTKLQYVSMSVCQYISRNCRDPRFGAGNGWAQSRDQAAAEAKSHGPGWGNGHGPGWGNGQAGLCGWRI
jgi:hypothetical protein